MDKEYWKPVKGYKGYYISDHGRVRGVRGSILKAGTDKKGYLHVALCKNGKATTTKVHRLVAEHFVAGDQSLTVDHKDGNKQNNHYSNLEWVTGFENLRRAGRTPMTFEEVQEARRIYEKQRGTIGGLARRYGVTRITMNKILKYQSRIYN